MYEVRESRREWKRARVNWEKEWWENILDNCNAAAGVGDTGKLYRNLRKLGERGFKKAPTTTILTKEEFKTHFQKVSMERFESDPEFLERMIDRAVDFRGTAKAVEWEVKLNAVPEFEEMVEEMKLMRESAPGEDGVRLGFFAEGRKTDVGQSAQGGPIHVCEWIRQMGGHVEDRRRDPALQAKGQPR